MASQGAVVSVFTSPYLSAGAPTQGEAKGLINYLTCNLSQLYNFKIMKFLDYITNNEGKLKNIGNNLFNVIYCFKKIIEAMNNIWEKFNDIEKKFFIFI